MQEYTSMSKKAFWCFRLNTNTTKTLSGLNIKISTYLYERWVSTPYVRQLKKWSSDTNPYFIHSDRADYPENMKELPYVQWLKVWKVRCLSEWIKNALYEQNVLSSHGLHRSTFGDERLNYRVRNGIGWSLSLWFRSYKAFSLYEPNIWSYQVTNFCAPWRLHSVMGKNHESKRNNQDKELDQLVLLAWNPYKSYSCSLSTS